MDRVINSKGPEMPVRVQELINKASALQEGLKSLVDEFGGPKYSADKLIIGVQFDHVGSLSIHINKDFLGYWVDKCDSFFLKRGYVENFSKLYFEKHGVVYVCLALDYEIDNLLTLYGDFIQEVE